MGYVKFPTFGADILHFNVIIQNKTENFATHTLICLDTTGTPFWISSGTSGSRAMPRTHVREADVLDRVELTEISDATRAQFSAMSGVNARLPDPKKWVAFTCHFSNGVSDLLAFHLKTNVTAAAEYARSIWPEQRQDCLTNRGETLSDLSDNAMLWLISQKVNAGILVFDENFHLLKVNELGRRMLKSRKLISLDQGIVVCGRPAETKALRQAVLEMKAGHSDTEHEYFLILRGAQRDSHVPMSLSKFPDENHPASLFLAMIPRPPEDKRIEKILIKMGLTPSEARVAALIRAGHSNRAAAEIAELSIETLNTYVKRAMSKLNVSCRSELAQLLTWQFSLERSL